MEQQGKVEEVKAIRVPYRTMGDRIVEHFEKLDCVSEIDYTLSEDEPPVTLYVDTGAGKEKVGDALDAIYGDRNQVVFSSEDGSPLGYEQFIEKYPGEEMVLDLELEDIAPLVEEDVPPGYHVVAATAGTDDVYFILEKS